MLLDQEKLAQLLLKDRPWIRSIERPLNQSQLQIEIALKEEGGV